MARRGRATATVTTWKTGGHIAGPGTLVFYVIRGGFDVTGRAIDAGSAVVIRALREPIEIRPMAEASRALSAVLTN